MSIESVMPSSHLILCHPLLLLPSIPPSIRVFSNESNLLISGQSTGVSALASFLPKNTQDRSALFYFTLFSFFYLFIYLFIYFISFFKILKSLILTCVPKHEPPSHLPPHNISLGYPHAPAPSMLYPASDIDW